MEKKFETNGINFLFKIKESILFCFFKSQTRLKRSVPVKLQQQKEKTNKEL